LSHARIPSTTLCLKIDGEVIEEHAQGDGQFDAFMNALAKIYTKN
jgi:D-citramalate synthase